MSIRPALLCVLLAVPLLLSPPPSRAEDEVPVICPSCGWEIPSGNRFCGNCGTPADGTAPAPANPPVAESAPAADPDTRLEVQRALQALDPKYRGVVYLFYYEDYPVKRIAQCLGLTQTTVRTRLDRARKQLKQLLGGEDRG